MTMVLALMLTTAVVLLIVLPARTPRPLGGAAAAAGALSHDAIEAELEAHYCLSCGARKIGQVRCGECGAELGEGLS